MAELKSCPFCGGERVEVLNALEAQPEMELIGMSRDNWNVLCNDCFAFGGTRRKALEAIEAWNQRKPRWISVEDMMPEEFVSVLVYMPGENPLPTVHEGYFVKDANKWYSNFFDRSLDEVTYWMPMPEPPEEVVE